MPPKPPKGKSKSKPQEEQRQESLQAVVGPPPRSQFLLTPMRLDLLPLQLTSQGQCLLPLANTPLIEYNLEFLAQAGIQDVFIYCGSHGEQLEHYINTSKWKLPSSPLQNLVLLKSDATSVGDAMRDLDNRGLITGDFLLVPGDVVSNISIELALTQHRDRRTKDKNAIMTMILREAGTIHRTKPMSHRPIFIIDPEKDRCLHYDESRASGDGGRHITLDPDLFSDHSEIEIREDLIDCQIDICTPDVLSLWSDNFDYQSMRTSFLFGVLKDYELNGKTIHTYVVADQYAARVKSLRAYDAISKDVMGRWTYPLCPDSNRMPGQTYQYGSSRRYEESGVSRERTSRIRGRCVLGQGTAIGEGATIGDSILGRRCKIAANTTVEGSYLWDDVSVGAGSTIERAVVAEDAVIGKGCSIGAGALISFGVRIPDHTSIPTSAKIVKLKSGNELTDDHAVITSESLETGDYRYASESDKDSDASDSSGFVYKNPHASASASSVSTLQSEYSGLDSVEDRSRRASAISETSDEAVPNKDFHVEATASILDGLQKEDLPENIFLELNAFRMTVDASQHEIRRAVVAAFIKRIANLEGGGMGAREAVNKIFSKYKTVVERTIFDKDSDDKPDQIDFLLSVQKELLSKEKGDSLLLFMAKELYDLDLIEEDGVLQWWADPKSSNGNMAQLRRLTESFITFLQEAEEEEESEEDDDDE
ncbi:MAG: hypothetical protein Q9222_003272 [Ikaeria aurantiellina]